MQVENTEDVPGVQRRVKIVKVCLKLHVCSKGCCILQTDSMRAVNPRPALHKAFSQGSAPFYRGDLDSLLFIVGIMVPLCFLSLHRLQRALETMCGLWAQTSRLVR